jgi:uncharacterized protein YciI
MEFFCYHQDRLGSAALRADLVEAHWSYMDGYAAAMIARGPTFVGDGDGDGDGDTATGSVHVVDLAGSTAARAFAFDEPNYQAGVYRAVLLRRWRNMLGRTMWESPAYRTDGNRYLVIGLGPRPTATIDEAIEPDELIAYGPLLSDDGASWLGTAALLSSSDQDAASAILTEGSYAHVEVHRWQPGGRPS